MKELNRRHFHRLWLKNKTDDTHGISTDDKRLIAVMPRHEDRYGPLFDNPDLPVTDDPDEDALRYGPLPVPVEKIQETETVESSRPPGLSR